VSPEFCSAPFWQPTPLTLVRDDQPRPTSALGCRLRDLEPWINSATTRQMEALQAAWNGERVLLLGSAFASIPGQRYWGRDVLVPLGWRPKPLLPETILCAALNLPAEEIALFAEHVERISRSAFGPLTRAGVRLALEGAQP
jgi:hypothetical protein